MSWSSFVPSRPVFTRLLLLALVLGQLSCDFFFGRPDEPGPFPVGRTSFEIVDPDRGDRTLPVDVWYPAVDDGATPPSVYDLVVASIVSDRALDSPPVAYGAFPLLIFSHGSGGVRYQSYFLCEQLASHGFIVASADHIGNSAGDIFLPEPPPFETKDRPLDVSLLITRMLEKGIDPADPFFLAIDPFRIGVLGHSFGAFTTLAMASGFEDVPPDPRVSVIMPIAPATGGLSDEQLATIATPTFVLGGTLDDVTPIDPNSVRAFEATNGVPRWRVDLIDAGHNSFTNICDFADALLGAGLPPELLEFLLGSIDQGCAPELVPIEEAHRITSLYAVSFFQNQLRGLPRFRLFLTKLRVLKEDLPVDFFQVREKRWKH
ncbi:MAG: hypothetical protein QNK04_00355 [Myxococcota bacterium]|nr:hypothetical protein [Myxococcota bacterium]